MDKNIYVSIINNKQMIDKNDKYYGIQSNFSFTLWLFGYRKDNDFPGESTPLLTDILTRTFQQIAFLTFLLPYIYLNRFIKAKNWMVFGIHAVRKKNLKKVMFRI